MHLLLSIFFILWSLVKSCTDNQEAYQVTVSYISHDVCVKKFLWWCTRRENIVRYRPETRYRCCTGWSGYRCRTAVCSCRNGGTCVAPNVCKCPIGYKGNSCEKPVCYEGCAHGFCSSPNHCSCYQGYTGRQCEKPVCQPSCQHDAQCVSPNTCHCTNGYTGVNCNQPICKPTCRNGGTCNQERKCVCTSEYSGPSCTIPVCNPPCQNNGTCVAPNQCICDGTYTGNYCETPLCSYHTPCFPGKCVDNIHCQCEDGFSGQYGLDLCKIMSASLHPTIAQCTSFLAKIERTGQKRELYKYMSDSSEPNSTRIDTRWVNEKDYNFVNVQFSATFNDLSGFKYQST